MLLRRYEWSKIFLYAGDYTLISERKRIIVKHIFIVDNKSIFCYGAAVALKKAGYRVSTAPKREDAFDMILQDRTIDLVLVETLTPNMAGGELVKAIKKSGITTPVAVIAAWIDADQVSELLKKGYAAFIDNQVEPRDFVKQIEILILNHLPEPSDQQRAVRQ